MSSDLLPALALAFSAGSIAAFNPCGFAMLPGYLALFLGERSGRRAGAVRALAVGAAVTTGFVIVFGVAGLLVTVLSLSLGDWLSVVTAVLGLVLIVAGAAILAGRDLTVNLPRARMTVDGSPRGMVAYGVVYATVSLSCTLPVFLAAVVSAFTVSGGSVIVGVGSLLAYAAGMGAVLSVLALGTALVGSGVAARTRGLAPHVKRFSGAFLVLAGAYVTWYGWVEYRAFQGDIINSGPVAWVGAASLSVGAFIAANGPALVAGLGALLVGVGAVALLRRRRRPESSALGRGSHSETT